MPVSETVASPLGPVQKASFPGSQVFLITCVYGTWNGAELSGPSVFFSFPSLFLDNQLGLSKIQGCVLSTTNWHLPRALPITEQQGHLPSASMQEKDII